METNNPIIEEAKMLVRQAKQVGLTKEELCLLSGVHITTLRRWLRGAGGCQRQSTMAMETVIARKQALIEEANS